MKKEIGTKTAVVILCIVILVILWLGWRFTLQPKPGEEPPPPASLQPPPLAPPGTYFTPQGAFKPGEGPLREKGPMAPPDPDNLEQDMRQRRPTP